MFLEDPKDFPKKKKKKKWHYDRKRYKNFSKKKKQKWLNIERKKKKREKMLKYNYKIIKL